MADTVELPHYRFSGAELRRRRVESGTNREHLAVAVDRTKDMIQRYERGSVAPSVEMAAKLAFAIGCSPADLFVVCDD